MSLSETIKTAKAETGASLDDLSAMSAQRDPYRRDTAANRRDAEWVAEMIDAHVKTETVHPRGLPMTRPILDPGEDWIAQTQRLAARKHFEV